MLKPIWNSNLKNNSEGTCTNHTFRHIADCLSIQTTRLLRRWDSNVEKFDCISSYQNFHSLYLFRLSILPTYSCNNYMACFCTVPIYNSRLDLLIQSNLLHEEYLNGTYGKFATQASMASRTQTSMKFKIEWPMYQYRVQKFNAHTNVYGMIRTTECKDFRSDANIYFHVIHFQWSYIVVSRTYCPELTPTVGTM